MVLSIARLAKVAVKAAEGIDSQGKVCLVPVSPALPWYLSMKYAKFCTAQKLHIHHLLK